MYILDVSTSNWASTDVYCPWAFFQEITVITTSYQNLDSFATIEGLGYGAIAGPLEDF